MCREVNSGTQYETATAAKQFYFNALDIYKYISPDLCEAYNTTGKCQRCSSFHDLSFASASWDPQKLLVDSTPVE